MASSFCFMGSALWLLEKLLPALLFSKYVIISHSQTFIRDHI